MGTKQRRDLVVNANVLQEPLWPEDVGPQGEAETRRVCGACAEVTLSCLSLQCMV